MGGPPRYIWRFDVVLENLPHLLSGLWLTCSSRCSACSLGLVVGLVVAMGRLSRWRPIRAAAFAYTEVFRTTPLLVQIVWVFYVLPIVTGDHAERVLLGPGGARVQRRVRSWRRSTAPASCR